MHNLGVMETRFADMIWERAPVSSGELVKLCGTEFGWKKSTTYTMLRRLCERGLFKNQDGAVTALITKSEFCAMQSEQFIETAFGGSLPGFIASFFSGKKLTPEQAGELRRLIDEHEEAGNG